MKKAHGIVSLPPQQLKKGLEHRKGRRKKRCLACRLVHICPGYRLCQTEPAQLFRLLAAPASALIEMWRSHTRRQAQHQKWVFHYASCMHWNYHSFISHHINWKVNMQNTVRDLVDGIQEVWTDDRQPWWSACSLLLVHPIVGRHFQNGCHHGCPKLSTTEIPMICTTALPIQPVVIGLTITSNILNHY